MQVVRIYTGDDGESHFEDIDLPYQLRTLRTFTFAAISPVASSIGTRLRFASM